MDRSALRLLHSVLLVFAALAPNLCAQAPQAITVVMLDGKTGRPLIPDNFVVRFDRRNAIRNETLDVNDDGTGKITLPPGVSSISLQGTFHGSLDFYINCDAGMEKDTSTLHWYPLADILSAGVRAPNECYKGKYPHPEIMPKRGQFTFFVREPNMREKNAE